VLAELGPYAARGHSRVIEPFNQLPSSVVSARPPISCNSQIFASRQSRRTVSADTLRTAQSPEAFGLTLIGEQRFDVPPQTFAGESTQWGRRWRPKNG
jgi:hypothetical protein